MTNQQRAFQSVRKIDWRTLFVSLRIVLRQIQNVRSVAVVVMRPVSNGPQRRAGRKNIGRRKQRHQCNKAAVAAAVKSDSSWVDAILLNEVVDGVNVIGQVFAAHAPINTGTPIAPVASRAAT